MQLRSKLLLAGLAAALLMALGTSSSAARNFSVNETGFALKWLGGFTIVQGIGETACPVTLAGRFHSRTIVKTAGLLIGTITSATLLGLRCLGGAATVLTGTLPWHVVYRSFTGGLPSITSVSIGIIGLSIQGEVEGIICLFRTDAAEPAVVGMEPVFATLDASAEIDLEDDRFLCAIAGDVTLSGTGVVHTGFGGAFRFTLI